MWKNSIFLCCLLLAAHDTLSAHRNKVDSLLNAARDVYRTNPQKTKQLEESALDLAYALQYSEGIVRSHYYLGYYYQKQTDRLDKSIEHYLKAIKNYSPEFDSLNTGWYLYAQLNTANVLTAYKFTEAAKQFYAGGRLAALDLNNTYELNNLDYRRYVLASKEADYEQGMLILQGIMARTEQHENFHMDALNSIGVCYSYLKEYDLAFKTYQEVIKLAKLANKPVYEDFGYHNLADLLIKNGKWKEAEEHLSQVLKIKLERETGTKKDRNLLATYKDLLLTKIKTGQPEFVLEIENDLNELLTHVKKKNPDYHFKVYPLLADAHASLGNNEQVDDYNTLYLNDSLAYFNAQQRIDYELNRERLQTVVNAYYAELEDERKEVRSQNLLVSAVVGLSLLIVILIAYHFLSRYRVRKMLTESLEQLKWED